MRFIEHLFFALIGVRQVEGRSKCLDIDYNRELFQSVAENSIKELKRREDETSIPIVDFIQNNQSSTKLFHVMNHPVNALLLEYSGNTP